MDGEIDRSIIIIICMYYYCSSSSRSRKKSNILYGISLYDDTLVSLSLSLSSRVIVCGYI